MRIEIRPLRPDDTREAFASGDVDLDRFFQLYAGQNQFRLHVGSTYVAVHDRAILGYMTIAPASITIDSLPAAERKRLPHYPLPVLRLARLAVASNARGHGLGARLLRMGLELAREMAERFGCIGVIVDAKPAARAFYRRYGFEELTVVAGGSPARPPQSTLFLPIGAIPRRT